MHPTAAAAAATVATRSSDGALLVRLGLVVGGGGGQLRVGRLRPVCGHDQRRVSVAIELIVLVRVRVHIKLVLWELATDCGLRVQVHVRVRFNGVERINLEPKPRLDPVRVVRARFLLVGRGGSGEADRK